jgi:DnaJ-class molecular chaperone
MSLISLRERVFVFNSAGHASIRDAKNKGPVIVHMRLAPLPACVSLCEDPIVPEDAYDIHVHLDADLTAAFFGRLVDLPAFTGIPALSRFSPVRVPPFANDPEPRRITIVRGAGFGDNLGNRGNLVIHSELRLPRISPVTLSLHERLIRSALRTLQALQ